MGYHVKAKTSIMEKAEQKHQMRGSIVASGHHSCSNCEISQGIRKRKLKQDRKARRLDHKRK
jgi:hypothetical protein